MQGPTHSPLQHMPRFIKNKAPSHFGMLASPALYPAGPAISKALTLALTFIFEGFFFLFHCQQCSDVGMQIGGC